MSNAGLGLRARNKWRRTLVRHFARRPARLCMGRPLVSFTFDDFPLSALTSGGEILRRFGAAGTYYMANSLLGRESEVGPIASANDVRRAVMEGHEVGCHTFHHLDAVVAEVDAFRRSIQENQRAFQQIVAGAQFRSFAYPFDGPRLAIKRAIRGHFLSCRGGGQRANVGSVDLELVGAYFIDHRNTGDMTSIGSLIEHNARSKGWLVFATHDVSPNPSPFGCTPSEFETIVQMTVESGAEILTVAGACDRIGVR